MTKISTQTGLQHSKELFSGQYSFLLQPWSILTTHTLETSSKDTVTRS